MAEDLKNSVVVKLIHVLGAIQAAETATKALIISIKEGNPKQQKSGVTFTQKLLTQASSDYDEAINILYDSEK